MPRKGLLITVDPHNVDRFDTAARERLEAYLGSSDVWGVALSDVGGEGSQQEGVFVALAQSAAAAQVAVVVQATEQADRQLDLLRQAGIDFARVALVNGLLGCDQIQPWLEAGCCIAYDGNVTYAENAAVREAAKATPLDRMLCASNQPGVTPSAIAAVPGGIEDVVWVVGELVELKLAFGREAFMAVYDALLDNAKRVLGL